MPTVEVIRGPGVNAQPMILVQRREDEETFAMTVQQAHAWLDKNRDVETTCQECVGTGSAQSSVGMGTCLWCMVYDALQGLP